MGKCFVIQSFGGIFNKRFDDVFQPAINAAGLNAYRIDNDLAVRILIDDIEKGILESEICFADVTLNNPNVWYELGFAYACGKDVILVCAEDRSGPFPFDIQHKAIIRYKTGSKSDFQTLEENITKKILAFLNQSQKAKKLHDSPVVDTEGLKSNEIAILLFIAENQFTDEESVGIYRIKNQMEKAGYNDLGTAVGLRTLLRKGFVTTLMVQEHWNSNDEFSAARLTTKGEDWILDNQDKLVFRSEKTNEKINSTITPVGPDDLPF
jgi:hypothetical protein